MAQPGGNWRSCRATFPLFGDNFGKGIDQNAGGQSVILGKTDMTLTMRRKRQDVEIKVHCLSEQKIAYELAASRDGRTLSAWIRHVLDQELKRSSVESGEHFPEFPEKS